jgi:hypothetical protein
MQFKGWDWTELLKVWEASKKKWPEPTPEEPFLDEEEQAKFIRQELYTLACSPYTNRGRSAKQLRQIKDIRNFVTIVGKISDHAAAPIFVGLSKISDDETFLKYTDILLEHLWT